MTARFLGERTKTKSLFLILHIYHTLARGRSLFPLISMSSDKKDKDKKSSTKPADKKDKRDAVTSEQKLDQILLNLDSNKYTSLSFKTKFAADTTRLLKHAKKSTSLTALEISGPGIADVNTHEILQLLEASQALVYLRMADHCLDPTSISRIFLKFLTLIFILLVLANFLLSSSRNRFI